MMARFVKPTLGALGLLLTSVYLCWGPAAVLIGSLCAIGLGCVPTRYVGTGPRGYVAAQRLNRSEGNASAFLVIAGVLGFVVSVVLCLLTPHFAGFCDGPLLAEIFRVEDPEMPH